MSGKKKKRAQQSRRPFDTTELFETSYSHHIKGDYAKAEEGYARIIRMDPKHSNALNLLGTIFLERGECDKALELIQKAVKAYPLGAMFHNNLGNVFRKMGLEKDAEKAYREALRVDPGCVSASNNLGTILQDQGDMQGAIDCYETAHRKDPGFAPAYYNLGRVFCEQGRIDTSIWAYREALKINPGFYDAFSNLLYTYHFNDQETPEKIFDAHRVWAETFAQPHYHVNPVWNNDRDPDRKLRVGFVSPDFRTHSVAFFLEDVFAHRNRERIEVACYSNTEKQDQFTQRFRELADVWRDITVLSDDEAARIIREDRIDILVDLAGHTRGSRLLIFARKPAPVQVTWLGYPDTTGLDTMDYRLTDAIADPPDVSDHLATETLVRLEGGFLCYKPSGESYPISPSPALLTGAVTFGSFNNNSKISERVIAVWAKILRKTPGSRLKLKSRSFADFGTRKHILERFDHYGVPSERIWFEGYRVTLKEHFLLYNSVDIALDTFPYNGTTTTCEALWMGVPVIALAGNSHVSRVGASLLHQAGLDALLAFSEEEYVEKAVNLSRDIHLLSEIRLELRSSLTQSTLMDPTGFSERLENAFRAMWHQWVANVPQSAENVQSEIDGEIYEKNLKALREHHPYIKASFDEKTPFDLDLGKSPSGIPNLLIRNRAGDTTWLYPENDPLGDLEPLIQSIRSVDGRVLCVLGGGLLIHASSILEAVGQRNLVVFFEAWPKVFKAALQAQDLTAVLAHPNVRFAIGDSADPYMVIHEERDKLFTTDEGAFAEHSLAVALAPAWYADRRQRFDQYLKRRKISRDTVAFSGKSFIENSFRNLLALSESRPLDDLCDLYKHVPAVIVASGPSLAKNIHELKSLEGRALIIALDSALAPLMALGIKPHMVVSVDNNDFTFEKLAPFIDDLGDVDLVYIPTVTPRIPNGIRFRSAYYSFPDATVQNLFNGILGRNGSALEDVQSVFHLALAAAQKAGCDPVVFVGLDLAFSDARDHVEGTILHWGNHHGASVPGQVMVEGIDGQMIPSNPGFVGMLEICQRMIQTVPDRTYIDATEGGAKVKGTRILPLATVIESSLDKPFEGLKARVDKERTVPCLNDLLARLNRLKQELDQCLKRIRTYSNEQAKVQECLKKHPRLADPKTLPADVLNAIRTMDKINTELEKNQVVENVKALMVEFFEQYKQLELDSAGVQESPGKRFVSALKQQGFVQEVRKTALVFFLQQVEQSTGWIGHLANVENQDPVSGFDTGKPVELLIQKDCLVKAETLLARIDNGPLNDFYRGCLALKKGRIGQGKDFFARACEQDKAFAPRIQAFNESLIQSWLKDGPRIQSLGKLLADRILELEPVHPEGLRMKRQWLLQWTHEQMDGTPEEGFLDKLLGEWERWGGSGWESMAAQACLQIILGNEKGSLIFLERLSGKGTDLQNGIALISGWLKKTSRDTLLAMGSPVTLHLVMVAEDNHWAKGVLQELFWIHMNDRPGKVMRKLISVRELEEMSLFLEQWAGVKHLIPEWCYLESFRLLAHANLDGALAMMERAVSVEEQTVRLKSGPGYLRYFLGTLVLVGGDESRALAILRDVFDRYPENVFGLTVALLMIRNGSEDMAEGILRNMFHGNDEPFWIGWVGEMFKRCRLISDFKALNSLTFYSAYYVFIGKCFLDNGGTEYGKNLIRASVNHDARVADGESGRWVFDLISDMWSDEIQLISDALAEGRPDEADRRLDEWRETRWILESYHTVRASVIAAKDHDVAAVQYLKGCVGELCRNPQDLMHASLNLFEWGKADEALAILDQAVGLNHAAANVWENLGDAFFNGENLDMALTMYEKGLTAFPDNKAVLIKIGDVYTKMGRLDAAEMAYQAVIAMKGQDRSPDGV